LDSDGLHSMDISPKFAPDTLKLEPSRECFASNSAVDEVL